VSIFRRLRGGPPSEPKSTFSGRTAQMHIRYVTFDDVRGDARVEVVGEQYHAEAVEAFRRFCGPAGVAEALLMRQPDNPKDTNAIAVSVWTSSDPPEAAHVGYLLRDDAAAYRPVFEFMGDVAIRCEAAIAPYRGGGGTDGVVLHLGTPGELIAEAWLNANPVQEDHPWHGQVVAFTGFGTRLAGVTLDRDGQRLLARRAGCLIAQRLTKKVAVLVATDGDDETGQLARARDYGIPVVDEAEFWQTLGVPGAALSKGPGRWAQSPSRTWR
jgi:hypothetical protein